MAVTVKKTEAADLGISSEVAAGYFTITHTRTVKDVNGVEFEVVDRVEQQTLESLEAQKAAIQDKIDKINALPVEVIK